MNCRFTLSFGLVLACLGLRNQVNAQFYAPDTENHDPVQKLFVVETARVLAWLANRSGSNIAQVTYQVTTKQDGATSWDVRWLDAAGKPLKTVVIAYPSSLLKAGPGFYQSIFKQLWMTGWLQLSGIRPEQAAERFWRGAAKMGPSREHSLATAFELAQGADLKSSDEWMPELAGLLTHAVLPGIVGHLTLDRVVLARGAAWLALTEQCAARTMDDLWAPVLFQAGRERVASELWNKEHPAKLPNRTAAEAGWNIWLRKPVSKDVYLFATESTNLAMAMPMLAYDVVVNQTGAMLADLIEPLVGSAKRLALLQNYAPLFATRTSVGGGHVMNGAWPVFGRFEWLRLLSGYRTATNDYQGYLGLMRNLTNQFSRKLPFDQNLDPSLYGFREAAPLISLGRAEGVGLLDPTAVATARDLLNYGWESTGLQMGSRYRFVSRMWGVRSQAEPILRTVTGETEGLMPFFLRSQQARLYDYEQCLERLQFVDGLFRLAGYSPQPFGPKSAPAEGARLFVKRCWLRPLDFDWQARSLWGASAIPEVTDVVVALQDQGGALAAAAVVIYLNSFKGAARQALPRYDELRYALAETLPEPTPVYWSAIYDRRLRRLNNFDRGRETEKLYWQNPDSQLEEHVFEDYIVSGAYQSARRFYTDARENLVDPVGFSNRMGKMVYVLGYLLNDATLRRQALEDSRSASYADMLMHIWDAAMREDDKELERDTKDLIERYEENQGADSRGRRLLRFLPLLPALRKASDPAHNEALHYFGKDPDFVTLRWIWIERCKLPPTEAIAFLGGRENDLLRRVLVLYLDKDATQMLDALNQFNAASRSADEQGLLASYLYRKLHSLPAPEPQTDLKPPGALSVRKAVLEKLRANSK